MHADPWLRVLARECKRTSQAETAALLGVSGAVVNQVLQRKYPGNTQRIQAIVEGRLMGAIIECPVIGEIPRDVCIAHRTRRKFAATNPLRVQLHRTCPTCPNYPGGET
jgi:hypothetical protein